MELEQIWTYPVKSMIGQRVRSADITTTGLVGDRRWAVRDEVRGGIRGAKKFAALMRAEAIELDGRIRITLPDGAEFDADDPSAAEQLTRFLGSPVSLLPLPDATDLDHFRRGAPDSDDIMIELRSIFGREEDEPLPDLSIFPPEIIEFEAPPGTHHDAFPLMIMTTSALRSLAAALPDSAPDVRRFRPSILIDSDDLPGHPEFEWVGRRMRIGSVEVAIGAACPRCVMVTREINDGLPADRSILRHIVRDLDQNLGVYATVITPGAIEEGDSVTLLD